MIRGWEARRNATTLVLGLDTFDAQADIFGGYADIRATVNGTSHSERLPINRLLPGGNPNDPELNLFLYVTAPPGYVIRSGVPISFDVSVTDRNGHRSNTIRGFFVTETPAGQAVDGPMGPLQFEVQLGK